MKHHSNKYKNFLLKTKLSILYINNTIIEYKNKFLSRNNLLLITTTVYFNLLNKFNNSTSNLYLNLIENKNKINLIRFFSIITIVISCLVFHSNFGSNEVVVIPMCIFLSISLACILIFFLLNLILIKPLTLSIKSFRKYHPLNYFTKKIIISCGLLTNRSLQLFLNCLTSPLLFLQYRGTWAILAWTIYGVYKLCFAFFKTLGLVIIRIVMRITFFSPIKLYLNRILLLFIVLRKQFSLVAPPCFLILLENIFVRIFSSFFIFLFIAKQHVLSMFLDYPSFYTLLNSPLNCFSTFLRYDNLAYFVFYFEYPRLLSNLFLYELASPTVGLGFYSLLKKLFILSYTQRLIFSQNLVMSRLGFFKHFCFLPNYFLHFCKFFYHYLVYFSEFLRLTLVLICGTATFFVILTLLLVLIFLFYHFFFFVTDFYTLIGYLLSCLISCLEFVSLRVFSFLRTCSTTPPLIDWFGVSSFVVSEDLGEEGLIKDVFRRANFFFSSTTFRPFSFSALVFLISSFEAVAVFYLDTSSLCTSNSILLNSISIFFSGNSLCFLFLSKVQCDVFPIYSNITAFADFLSHISFEQHLDYKFLQPYTEYRYIIFFERQFFYFFDLVLTSEFSFDFIFTKLYPYFFNLFSEIFFALFTSFYFFLLDLNVVYPFLANKQIFLEVFLRVMSCFVVVILTLFDGVQVYIFFMVRFFLIFLQVSNFLFLQFAAQILYFFLFFFQIILILLDIFLSLIDSVVLRAYIFLGGIYLLEVDFLKPYLILWEFKFFFPEVLTYLSLMYMLLDFADIFNFFFFWLQSVWLIVPQIFLISVIDSFLWAFWFFFQKCYEIYFTSFLNFANLILVTVSACLIFTLDFFLLYGSLVVGALLFATVYFNYQYLIQHLLPTFSLNTYSVLINELGTFLHYSGLGGFFTDIGLYFIVAYLTITFILIFWKLTILQLTSPLTVTSCVRSTSLLFLSKESLVANTHLVGTFDSKLTWCDFLFFRLDSSILVGSSLSEVYLILYPALKLYWLPNNVYNQTCMSNKTNTSNPILPVFNTSIQVTSRNFLFYESLTHSLHFFIRSVTLSNIYLFLLESICYWFNFLTSFNKLLFSTRVCPIFEHYITYFFFISRLSYATYFLEFITLPFRFFETITHYPFFVFWPALCKSRLIKKFPGTGSWLNYPLVLNFSFFYKLAEISCIHFFTKSLISTTNLHSLPEQVGNLPYLLLFPIFSFSNFLGSFYWYNYSESFVDLQLRRLITLSEIDNQGSSYENVRNGFNTKFLNELQLENMQLNSLSFNFRDLTKLYFRKQGWAEDYIIKYYKYTSINHFSLVEAKLLSARFLDRYLYNFVWKDFIKPNDFFIRHLSADTFSKIEVFEKNNAGTSFLNSPYKLFFYLTYFARTPELTSIFAGYSMLRDMSLNAEQTKLSKIALPGQAINLSESNIDWIVKLAKYFFFFNQMSLNIYFNFIVRSYKRFFQWYYLWGRFYRKWYPSSGIKHLTFTSQSSRYNLFYSFEKLFSIVLPVDDFSRFSHFDAYCYSSNLFFASRLDAMSVYNNWRTRSDNERPVRLTRAFPENFFWLRPQRNAAGYILRRFDFLNSKGLVHWDLFTNFYDFVLGECLNSIYVNKSLLYETKLAGFTKYNLIAKNNPLFVFRRMHFYKAGDFLKFRRPKNRIWFLRDRSRFFFDVNTMWFVHHFREISVFGGRAGSVPIFTLQNFLAAEYNAVPRFFFFDNLFFEDSFLHFIYNILVQCWFTITWFFSSIYQFLNWNAYLRLDRTDEGFNKVYTSLLFSDITESTFLLCHDLSLHWNFSDSFDDYLKPSDLDASVVSNYTNLISNNSITIVLRRFWVLQKFLFSYNISAVGTASVTSSILLDISSICRLICMATTSPSVLQQLCNTSFGSEYNDFTFAFCVFDFCFNLFSFHMSEQDFYLSETFSLWKSRHSFFKKLGHTSFRSYAVSSFTFPSSEAKLLSLLQEKYGSVVGGRGIDFSPYVNVIGCWNSLCSKNKNFTDSGLILQFPDLNLVQNPLDEVISVLPHLSLIDELAYSLYYQRIRGLFKEYCVEIIEELFSKKISLERRNELICELSHHVLSRAYAMYLYRAAHILQIAVFDYSSIRRDEPFFTRSSSLNTFSESHQLEYIVDTVADLQNFKIWYSALVGDWLTDLLTIPYRSYFLDATVDRASCKTIFDSFTEPRECGLEVFSPKLNFSKKILNGFLKDAQYGYYPSGHLFASDSSSLVISLNYIYGPVTYMPRKYQTDSYLIYEPKSFFFDEKYSLNCGGSVNSSLSKGSWRLKKIGL